LFGANNKAKMASTVPTTYRIASIPGDGIGPEVVEATIQVVKKLCQKLRTFDIDFTHIPWGTEYYKAHGRYASEDCLDTLRQFDAVLFGAVGAPGMITLSDRLWHNQQLTTG
jgi:isocitrate/isopropylmalate dehydrogenase